MKNELVSVVMPSHNNSVTLQASAHSVLSQTYGDLELLIVDDASTDDTAEVARAVSGEDPRVITIQLEENCGAGVARNTAIQRAKGRFIAFLDSDDLWSPKKLESQISAMLDHKWALSHTYYQRMDHCGSPLRGTVEPPELLDYKAMLKSNQIGCLTAAYDTHYLGKQYMPQLRKRQDYALWLKLLKLTPFAHVIPEVLAWYRVGGGSLSSSKVGLLRYNWKLFRQEEHLPIYKAAYYLGWNAVRKVLT